MQFMRMTNTIDFNNTKTPKQITGICPDSNGKFYIIDIQKNTHTIDVRNENWETVYYRIIKLFDDPNLSGIKPCENPGKDGSGQGIPMPLNEYGNFDGHVWIELSEDEQKQIEEQTNDQFAEAVTFEEKQNNNKQRGISDSWQQRILDNIAKPQVNWKTMLRRAIRKLEVFDFTYNKLNKRSYSYGYAMPTLLKDSVQCTLAIDVSGSISEKELSKFFAEFKGIINAKRNVKVRMLYWSTKVDKKNDITYTRRDFPKAIQMSKAINSTYGTEISCVAKYLAKNPGEKDSFKTIIYLTDGYIEEHPSFPPNSEIIFVIPSDGTDAIVKNFGKVIRIV
jgi:predicted metal-dependent peptidase